MTPLSNTDCKSLMKKKNKTVYFSPHEGIGDLGDLLVPIKKNTDNPLKKTGIGQCPAWYHQNARTYTFHASLSLQFGFDVNTGQFTHSTIDDEISEIVQTVSLPTENTPLVFELEKFFTNFYWTEEKNIWISVLPHPLTSLNNNFYHCGAQFNLSNWARVVNIGMVVVDPEKPVIINRGDPLYNIKFHTEDQNEEIDLVRAATDERFLTESFQKVRFVRSPLAQGYDYTKHLFESNPPEKKSGCPFSFLWKK